MSVYSIESAIMLEEGKRNNVTVEGLLENCEEDFDKAGRPYVKGTLTDKDLQLPFKCWQIDLKTFKKKIGIGEEDNIAVVNLTGKVDSFNDTVNFIVNDNANNKVMEKDVNEYIYAAPYKPEVMYTSIYKKVKNMKIPFYRDLCLAILDKYKNKFLVYPYSTTIHTERSGLLYHIYLCLCKASNLAGLPVMRNEQSAIDEELIMATIICNHLKGFMVCDVDELGRIKMKDDTSCILLGGEMCNLIFLNDIINNLIHEGKVNVTLGGEMEHLLHCVGCVCGSPIFVPATVEAEIAVKIISEELNMYKILGEYQSLGRYEARKVKVGKKDRTILKMPIPNPPALQEKDEKEAV